MIPVSIQKKAERVSVRWLKGWIQNWKIWTKGQDQMMTKARESICEGIANCNWQN